MKQFRLFLILLCVAAMAVPAMARGKKKTSTEPGRYTEWGPDIDEIEILQTFDFSGYESIVVVTPETADVALPDKDDNTYEPVRKVLASAGEGLVQGLRGSVDADVRLEKKSSTSARTLVLRTKVEELDPGSKAARYWAGFGAGAARAKISGEVVDAATGTVLARFTQERRSGVGVMGGGYQELMQRNLNAIGEDIANMLKAF